MEFLKIKKNHQILETVNSWIKKLKIGYIKCLRVYIVNNLLNIKVLILLRLIFGLRLKFIFKASFREKKL